MVSLLKQQCIFFFYDSFLLAELVRVVEEAFGEIVVEVSQLTILIHEKATTRIALSIVVVLLAIHGSKHSAYSQLLSPLLPL